MVNEWAVLVLGLVLLGMACLFWALLGLRRDLLVLTDRLQAFEAAFLTPSSRAAAKPVSSASPEDYRGPYYVTEKGAGSSPHSAPKPHLVPLDPPGVVRAEQTAPADVAGAADAEGAH